MTATPGTRESSRLLVVEDSASDFAMLEIELRAGPFSGATIDRATTLAAARDHLLAHDYDCALVDLGLPDSDGLDTFDAVAALAGGAAVVVLSGLDNQALAEDAVRRGAQDYLVKGGGEHSQVARAISYAVRRQRLLEALRTATAEQLALKDQLISHVSHELRSPLAVVHQFASLLGDGVGGPLTTEQRNFVDVLMRNVEQLRVMIDDLLEVARDPGSQVQLTCRRVDLTGLLREVADAYRPIVEEHGLRLVQVQVDLPMVLADPERTREVLGNLIDNAMKFTQAGGSITLSAAPTAEAVQVTVTDTGCGIDAADLPHVFENFFQSGQSDVAGRSGLGLGLFVSKSLVVRQGGRIWVTSTPRVGTAVSFTIPQALAPAELVGSR